MSGSHNSNLVWEKVLQRILPTTVFKVNQEGTELKVLIDKDKAKEAAEKLSLAFSQQIQLPYQMTPAAIPATAINKTETQAVTRATPFPSDDFKQQLAILDSLISKSHVIKATGINLSNLFIQSLNDSLVSESTNDNDILRIYDGYRAAFSKALAKLTQEQINQAFEGKPLTAVSQSLAIGENTARHCVGLGLMPGSKDNEQRLMVNLRNLHLLANSVQVQERPIEEKQVELSVPVQHFLLKLKQVLSDHGEMLISKEGAPIFFGVRDFIKPHLISFILDRSASMETHFSELQNQIRRFLAVLKTQKLDFPVDIRVTFFAENKDEAKDFRNIFKDDLQYKAVEEYISARHLLGNKTRLNMTIVDELEYIKTQQLSREKHVTTIIFTDGHDNVDIGKVNEIKNTIDSYKKADLPLPTGFVLALGDENNLDLNFLKSLSLRLSHTPPMLLQKMTDFAVQISQHLQQIESSSELKKIRWMVGDIEKEVSFNLLHNNTPQRAPDVKLPLTGTFKIQVDDKSVMKVEYKPTEVKLSDNNMWIQQSSNILDNKQLSEQVNACRIC